MTITRTVLLNPNVPRGYCCAQISRKKLDITIFKRLLLRLF